MAFAFFGQTMLCLAGDAGLIACGTSTDHQDRGTAQTEPAEADHCCHCTSHIPLLHTPAVAVLDARTGSEAFGRTNDSAPDGPVREIDYPPQLS